MFDFTSLYFFILRNCIFTVAATLVCVSANAKESDKNCPAGSYFVKAHPRSAYYRSDGTFVSASNVSSSCRPKTKAFEFWYDRISNARPQNWPEVNAKEIIKTWTTEEIERFLEAISFVPEVLWTTKVSSFVRMAKSIIPGNSGSGIPGHIALYDSAFAIKSNLSRVILHELAHEYFRSRLSNVERNEYLEQASWATVDDTKKSFDQLVWAIKPNSYVEPDGQSSPEEDFANNVEYYLFNRTKLQVKNQRAYEWLRDHFGSKMKKVEAK